MLLEDLQARQKYWQRWVAKQHAFIRYALERTALYEGGRTITVRMPDDLRERILEMKAKHGLRSYRRTVITCVLTGLQMLEEYETPPPSAPPDSH